MILGCCSGHGVVQVTFEVEQATPAAGVNAADRLAGGDCLSSLLRLGSQRTVTTLSTLSRTRI